MYMNKCLKKTVKTLLNEITKTVQDIKAEFN